MLTESSPNYDGAPPDPSYAGDAGTETEPGPDHQLIHGARAAMHAASVPRSYAAPVALLLTVLALYSITLWATFHLRGVARIPMGLLNGYVIAMAFVIGHDACHGSFFPSSRLNQLVGRAAFLPCLLPFSFWELGHNRLHHGWTNLRPKDYGWAPFSKEEFDRLGPARRLLERVGRTFLGVGVHYTFALWWPHMAFPRQEELERVPRAEGRFDRCLVLGFFLAETLLCVCLEAHQSGDLGPSCLLRACAFGIAVPYAMYSWLFGLVTFLQHNHERVRWYDRRDEWTFAEGALLGTVHVTLPAVVDAAFLNSLFHTAHHVDSRIPLYRLGPAQEALEGLYEKEVIRVRFTLGSALTTFRRCKLYDFRRHVWLDFAGNSTALEEVDKSRQTPAVRRTRLMHWPPA